MDHPSILITKLVPETHSDLAKLAVLVSKLTEEAQPPSNPALTPTPNLPKVNDADSLASWMGMS